MRRMQRRYGDAYTLRLPVIGTTVVVSHPDLVKAVFTAKPTVLHGGKNPLGGLLGPGSLFSMDEDRHLEERRRLLPPFHGDRMRSYDRLIEDEALRAMQSWPDGEEFPSIVTFNRITLRVDPPCRVRSRGRRARRARAAAAPAGGGRPAAGHGTDPASRSRAGGARAALRGDATALRRGRRHPDRQPSGRSRARRAHRHPRADAEGAS